MSTINLTQLVIDNGVTPVTVDEPGSIKAEYRSVLKDSQTGGAILISNSATEVVYTRKSKESGCPACTYTFTKEEVADPVIVCTPYTC